jgi:hypothetical protein
MGDGSPIVSFIAGAVNKERGSEYSLSYTVKSLVRFIS